MEISGRKRDNQFGPSSPIDSLFEVIVNLAPLLWWCIIDYCAESGRLSQTLTLHAYNIHTCACLR